MKKIIFFSLISFVFVAKGQHPNFALAEKKFEEGLSNEKKYYVNFNQEYFINSYTAYHEAASLYIDGLSKCAVGEKIYASYHAMKCLYAEAEVFNAMETPKKIYDLYVPNFDKLIPDSSFNHYKQIAKLKISKINYDSIWVKTLDILYTSSIKVRRELYTIKCGSMLLNHYRESPEQYNDILYHVIIASGNVAEAQVLLYHLQLWTNLKDKPIENNPAIIKAIDSGLSNHPDSFSEEQVKTLEGLKKKLT
ncbi:MAG: hypothetical protein SGJ10_08095 [Bacteroidota bacterium]|nr:hypothetical protein [Bacteroidota bacterium]